MVFTLLSALLLFLLYTIGIFIFISVKNTISGSKQAPGIDILLMLFEFSSSSLFIDGVTNYLYKLNEAIEFIPQKWFIL